MITRYGKHWPEGVSDLDIELWCYAHDDRAENERGRLTRWDHFRNAADLLWNCEGSSRNVIWNDWTDDMLKAMIEHQYVGFAGAGSSGKSEAAAVFAIVDWLAASTETMFLVCSTTLAGARGRIWKSVSELWGALEARWTREGVALPGKMVMSKGRIVGVDINGQFSESIGLWLIAAGKDDEGEADKKLKGLKAPAGGRLRLIADEFSDLGMCVLTAMLGNLASNENFKGIGMANPGSKLTPFGKFVTPEAGWQSLSVGMTKWKTLFGVCLSFDATRSPRILHPERVDSRGRHLYHWMPTAEYIAQAKKAFGEDSLEYWAQIRGMFCPTGMERTVWSETELLAAMAPVREDEWDFGCVRVKASALDPAFVTGGDRSPICWAEFGTIKGVRTMNFLGLQIVAESGSEVTNSDGETIPITVSENVIEQFREHAKYHEIQPRRAGFDATGGGVVFGQWLHTKWSHAVHAINFGGKPAERRADSQNEETIYKNRVTQLWIQPKALVRQGQIRGVPMEVIEELCQRRYHTKNHTGSTACVEEKPEMKKRIGKSPDCFIAGTLVSTPSGLIPIELVQPGDVVLTPFGPSSVFAVHVSKTDLLTELQTNRGHILVGKGAHKIFTHDQGWVAMDTLSFTNELESVKTLPLWNFLKLLFTPVGNTAFKPLVDTIKVTPKTSRKDFFTGPCGPIIMDQFRRAWTFITSMMTGLTPGLTTWNYCSTPTIAGTTCSSALPIQSTAPGMPLPFWPLRKKLRNGMPQTLAGNGIASTEKPPGLVEMVFRLFAAFAASLTSRIFQAVTNAVPSVVATSGPRPSGFRNLASASCAALVSWLTSLLRPKLVTVSVRPISPPESVAVFNLTLEDHNAYYANGLLVANCADTFCILVEVAILNGLLDVMEIRKVDRAQNQQWKALVDGQMMGASSNNTRKSVIAMPTVKRLKHSRR